MASVVAGEKRGQLSDADACKRFIHENLYMEKKSFV